MRPKICFFSPAAYSYLAQKDTGTAGGAELQQVLLARELVKKGFDVSFMVDDYGQENCEIRNGIKILKFKGNRFTEIMYYPLRIYLLLRKLSEANAEIYYQRTATAETGIIAFFCRIKKKKFVYGMASDIEVDGTYEKTAKFYERFLYNFGLRKANCIIVQSQYQQRLLKKKFNLDCSIIKNPIPLNEVIKKDKCSPPIVLWVGTIKPEWKQPGLFLELARSIPEARFQMVGGAGNKLFYDSIKENARQIPNLEFIGFIPYPDVNEYFNRATVLVNTSTVEGFSNTFLQAWAGYTPVVSLNVDPDEIICRYELGFHSKTFDQMVKDVKRLLHDEKLIKEMGENGRRHIEREHDINIILNKYIVLFKNLA